jgi:NRAMP (natural resistance-associated macrophage protein)-like metal ion transporter
MTAVQDTHERSEETIARSDVSGGWWRKLGPGLVTGASDDDPSGIATYSQVGASFGYGMAWTALLTFPMMVAVQEICDRVALATGSGLGAAVRTSFSKPVRVLVGVLLTGLMLANVLNIAADLLAIGAGMHLLHAGPVWLWAAIAGCGISALLITGSFAAVAKGLRLLALVLLVYLPVVVLAGPDPAQVLKATFIPHVSWNSQFVGLLVAVLGTTISPYLFFWQATYRVEDMRAEPDGGRTPVPLDQRTPAQAKRKQRDSRLDVLVGMGLSNMVMWAIIVAAGATLHQQGQTNIDGAAQAAQALRPDAGPAAEILFAFGFIATGLLTVPVLAGSASSALAGLAGKTAGYSRSPRQAPLFYSLVVAGSLLALGLTFLPVNPIHLLVVVATVNGVAAAPFLTLIMIMSGRRTLMGTYVNGHLASVLGWATTIVMAAAAAALFIVGP